MEKEFVVGVTGASGIIYARRLLEVLSESATVRLVVTETARGIARHEGVSLEGLRAVVHDDRDLAATVSSGSYRYDGMVIIPCSMKTLAAVSSGYSETLITRAADVCLKERRPCVLVLREMPLSRIHLTNMLTAHDAGATVMVASPGFYHRPKEIRDLVDMVVARVLDHLGVAHDLDVRWRGYDA
ncbi:MAG: UbiX family flavin prenyltransferase [Methanomicrobiales archaeon]|nr:UbiX family flavin prenyltransferase [Methanomicrobiales archaeon]MDD1645366.1 UbiX family flavin prenyltransferase [Methanomicrobiales archaeon]MDD1646249.1 UbiX family flavin prenyltransferase [Methanomicrobiales archaeon]MDD1648702.1 UbiX family flavin prenyltransferase [Methanomicrobiales archaeon]